MWNVKQVLITFPFPFDLIRLDNIPPSLLRDNPIAMRSDSITGPEIEAEIYYNAESCAGLKSKFIASFFIDIERLRLPPQKCIFSQKLLFFGGKFMWSKSALLLASADERRKTENKKLLLHDNHEA